MKERALFVSVSKSPSRRAFTLVELLVVIAIIGILVALLLPAIQAARKAARRTQCKNNLRQVAIACLNHESTHKSFPYNGWSFGWMGDPDQGFGPQQPGGWVYAITPYLEEGPLFQIGKGMGWDAKRKELAKQMEVGIATFNCPSRRTSQPQPAFSSTGVYCDGNTATTPGGNVPLLKNAVAPSVIAKTDYAINGGAGGHLGTGSGGQPSAGCLAPGNGEEEGSSTKGSYPVCDFSPSSESLPGALANFEGVSTHRYGVRLKQINDGASKTLLVGEKMVEPRFYEGACEDPSMSPPSKGNGGDNNAMYQGYDYDTTRWGAPGRDEDGVADSHSKFGSAHPGGFHIALCDGSVQTVDYELEPGIWGEYLVRNDSLRVGEDFYKK